MGGRNDSDSAAVNRAAGQVNRSAARVVARLCTRAALDRRGVEYSNAKTPTFEPCLGRLEEVVRKLESAGLPLDEAMKLFEEGMQLSRDCQKQLEEAEARVEILLKKAGGAMTAQPFDPEAEEEA